VQPEGIVGPVGRRQLGPRPNDVEVARHDLLTLPGKVVADDALHSAQVELEQPRSDPQRQSIAHQLQAADVASELGKGCGDEEHVITLEVIGQRVFAVEDDRAAGNDVGNVAAYRFHVQG